MYDEQNEPLGRLIYFTAQKIGVQAESFLRPYGLTLEQLHLIKTLAADGELSQQHLGVATNKSAGNMTRLINRLEKKGLVARRGNSADRRSLLVTLTLQGTALEQEIAVLFEQFSALLHQEIGAQEKEEVRRVLRRMTANLENMECSNKQRSGADE